MILRVSLLNLKVVSLKTGLLFGTETVAEEHQFKRNRIVGLLIQYNSEIFSKTPFV